MSYLHPSPKVLVKLGSIIVHVEELLSPDAHQFDLNAFRQLMEDSEVVEWLKGMDALALLPKKRKS